MIVRDVLIDWDKVKDGLVKKCAVGKFPKSNEES